MHVLDGGESFIKRCDYLQVDYILIYPLATIESEFVIVWLFTNKLFPDIKSCHFVRYDRNYLTKNSCLTMKRALSFRALLKLCNVSQFSENKEDLKTLQHGFSTPVMSNTKCTLKNCKIRYDVDTIKCIKLNVFS